MTRDVEARFELERAIVRNELELHYQPILDIDGKAIRGVEALVRWRHPERGLVAPQAFLPTAEREGLMHELTAWVLREALLQSGVWRRDGIASRVSVNLAASDLEDERFRRILDRSLRIAGGTEALGAEIRVPDATDTVRAAVADLRARRVPIALDDVTSVEQLDRCADLAIDRVKLGRDVASRAPTDPRAAEVARDIAKVADSRGLPLIAVGVEDARTLEFARQIGCVGAQGYHLAAPMTSIETGRWMRSRA